MNSDDYLIECSEEGSVMEEPCQMKGIFFDFYGVITREKNGTPTIIVEIWRSIN